MLSDVDRFKIILKLANYKSQITDSLTQTSYYLK